MSDHVNAEDDLVETIAKIISGAPFPSKASMNKARAVIEAVRSTRDGKIERLREAGQAIIDRMGSTFKARNGRDVGIEGEDGEKIWLVHNDDIEALRQALNQGTDK